VGGLANDTTSPSLQKLLRRVATIQKVLNSPRPIEAIQLLRELIEEFRRLTTASFVPVDAVQLRQSAVVVQIEKIIDNISKGLPAKGNCDDKNKDRK
jgi:hypothetical protein